MEKLSIVPLDKHHDRVSFSCGIDSLDHYIQKQAGQDRRRKIAITYVLYNHDTDKIAGYYALSATAIELVSLPETMQKKLPSYPCLPATLIGRLAIDQTYQKKGLGEIILVDALKRAYQASLNIASFAIVADTLISPIKAARAHK